MTFVQQGEALGTMDIQGSFIDPERYMRLRELMRKRRMRRNAGGTKQLPQ